MTELQIQMEIIGWAGYRSSTCPDLRLLFHVPNEGKRSVITGSLLKRAGLKSGVPDLVLPVPRVWRGKFFNGLFIELKNGNKKPSENQNWWLKALADKSYLTAVCMSFDSSVALISNYLNIEAGVAIPERAWKEIEIYNEGVLK